MKLLIISQYFYPEQFRINDVCFELAKRGHDITVLTGLPNYPEGEVFKGYEDEGDKVSIIHGVRVFRCNLRPRHRGSINLIRNYLSFVRHAYKAIKKIDSDFELCYVYGVSPITQALPALKYKKLTKTKVIYYCCDLWPESVRGQQNGHKEIKTTSLIYRIAKSISKTVYNNVDLILTKCLDFSKYINSMFGISYTKMRVLFEHAEEIYLNVNTQKVDNGMIDFMFLGNIGKIQNCDLIVRAFAKILDFHKNIIVHFVGDGSELNNIRELVIQLKIEKNIIFHGKVPVNDVIDYYNMADICILTLSHKTESGLTPPAKLMSYMAAAKPIIASIDGVSHDIIKEANCGLVVEADNEPAFVELIKYAVDNFDEVQKKGINGRKYFLSNFTLKNHIDGLIEVMESMLEL